MKSKFDKTYKQIINEEQNWKPPIKDTEGYMTKGAKPRWSSSIVRDEEGEQMSTIPQKVMFLKKHIPVDTLLKELAHFMGEEKFDRFFDYMTDEKKEGWLGLN
jgi:hypothetical protein